MSISNVSTADKLRIYLLIPFYLPSSMLRHMNDRFGQLYRALHNWWAPLLLYFGLARRVTLRYKNGTLFVASRAELGKAVSIAEFANIPERERRNLELKLMGESATMKLGGRKLRFELDAAYAFASEVYSGEHGELDIGGKNVSINVKGKDVVDVGAYLDNTSMYYALVRGAKHVYAFEPYPYIYRTAVRNVRANKLDRLITTYNAAVSGVQGSANIDDKLTSFGMIDAGTKKGRGSSVKVVSLDSVVKKLRLKHAALKVDCEGCEYSIFKRASSDAIRSFDTIHVEYHYGYSDIVERLRAEGYEVSYTKPIYNFRGLGNQPMLKGDIVAVLNRTQARKRRK